MRRAGLVDASGLKKVAKDDTGLLQQPASPKYRTALVEIYVRGQDFGGSDKSANGHRYDSIPFMNGTGSELMTRRSSPSDSSLRLNDLRLAWS